MISIATLKMHEKLYVRDPQSTDLGRKIIQQSVIMIDKVGFENFTFKKLGEKIGSPESTIYRYFENKHKLLIYIVAWYWTLLEYLVLISINNITNSKKKIITVIDLLSKELDSSIVNIDIENKALHKIVISESSKAYLSKDVNNNNKAQLFKPYKDLCARIAGYFKEYNPSFKYSRSLASTLVELAHFQFFFMNNLPSLTDFGAPASEEKYKAYLELIVFSALDNKKY